MSTAKSSLEYLTPPAQTSAPPAAATLEIVTAVETLEETGGALAPNRIEHLKTMSYLNWCGRGRPLRDDWNDWFHSEALRRQRIREAAYFRWINRGKPLRDDWTDWFPSEASEDTFRNLIGFTMQHQQQTNWCWSATATSVAAFFDTNTSWTQCSLANAELSRNDCCGAGASGPCNQPWYLDLALRRADDHLANMLWRPSTMLEIKNEIDNDRPMCLRVGWQGGGGHFLAIDGYNRDLDMVSVDDPWFGPSDVTATTLNSSYQGTGSWTHSYWTQA